MENIDAVVGGAGIWGCTVARILAERGRRVLVVEKRQAPGGNVRCDTDPETGIEVHTYGSHIFHTSDRQVWDFIRRFTDFNGYRHKVLARCGGKTYFMPVGLALANAFFGVDLEPGQLEGFLSAEGRREALFDAFFRGYTSKQWGRPPEEIDPSVIKRVPVRSSYDINYFSDPWQGIPSDGYNAIFERLLDHPGITLRTGAELRLENGAFFAGADPLPGGVPVYSSAPVDALFGYRFGELPWRSLRFERETLPISDFQGASVVNYTEASVPWTRIHEFKHYRPEDAAAMAMPKTAVMREYPMRWRPGDEPYYPVNNPASQALHEKYMQEAAKITSLVCGGRLGAYRYFDMDKSIAAAMRTIKEMKCQ